MIKLSSAAGNDFKAGALVFILLDFRRNLLDWQGAAPCLVGRLLQTAPNDYARRGAADRG
jgi:hypothetical protein